MEFSRPTTQSQLYSVLKDIFYYYRVRRAVFEEVYLDPLYLSRMEFDELTSDELLAKAQALNAAEQYVHDTKYVEEINNALRVVNEKLAWLETNKETRIEKINADFEQSANKLTALFSKNGLSNSSIAIDKLAQLELEKNRLIAEIEAEALRENTVLIGEQQALSEKQAMAQAYCAEKAERENLAKQKELLDEQTKIARDVFKYNNSLDEKEKRYLNEIQETQASLQLRFLEIQSGEFTKDQLVEMGYYTDVIDCVCAYYDTLPTLTAAQQIMKDKKIIQYLDDYYESVIYLYQQRALE